MANHSSLHYKQSGTGETKLLLKVNGERNSGTSFLHELLKSNFGEELTYRDRLLNGRILHWAHGVPESEVKTLNDKVVDVFVFRDLEPWLISMFKNPYELVPFENFEQFLTYSQTPFGSFRNAKDGSVINRDDFGKTIFDIRYHKFTNIVKYCMDNTDCVFVNLNTLQDESKCSSFIDLLKERYGLVSKTSDNIVSFPYQLATGKKIKNPEDKNRKYFDIGNYRDIIESLKHRDIERDISNLCMEVVC